MVRERGREGAVGERREGEKLCLNDGEGASGGVDELEEIEREGAGCRRNASGHGICRGCVHRGSNGDVFAG